MEKLLMVFSELNFAAAYEERRFFCESSSFYFNISFSPISVERQNVIAKSIAPAY
jgi:hypothetical protein